MIYAGFLIRCVSVDPNYQVHWICPSNMPFVIDKKVFGDGRTIGYDVSASPNYMR